MIQKKICLLGSHSVGKTCLIRQYVDSIYDSSYNYTIGAKVDKKILRIRDTDLTLVIWDLAGEDKLTSLPATFISGVAACLIVVDGARIHTAEVAERYCEDIQKLQDEIAVVVAINKPDAGSSSMIDSETLQLRLGDKATVVDTSATSSESVQRLFDVVASKILEIDRKS